MPLRHVFWGAPLVSALALASGAAPVIWLFPVFILPGIGWNVLWPHFADFVSRRAPDQQRATVISMANFVAGGATVIIAPLTGLAVDRLGMAPALIATSALLTLVVLLAYLVWWRAGDHVADPGESPEAVLELA